MDARTSKENYYLDIAQTVLERATCLRRRYGAIIVQNDEIISTGYNGAPRGRSNCADLGFCTREAMQVPRGERYELCRSVHAEANAIISASPPRHGRTRRSISVGRDAQTRRAPLTTRPPAPMCRRHDHQRRHFPRRSPHRRRRITPSPTSATGSSTTIPSRREWASGKILEKTGQVSTP